MNAFAHTNANTPSHEQANVLRIFPTDPSSTERKHESTESWGNRRVAETKIIEDSTTNRYATFTFAEQKHVAASIISHQEIAGTVVKFNEQNVECDVSHNDKHVTVVLPRVLFEFSIQYGTPFSLSLIDDEGIRKPRVTPRKPDLARFQSLREQAAELVDSL